VESEDPIKLTLHDWTGPAHHHQPDGRGAEERPATTSNMCRPTIWRSSRAETGDLHVAMEMWETTGRDAMDAATATGKVENDRRDRHAGQGGMVVSLYMKEKCPGLPNWEGAEGRLRRGLLHRRNRAQGPLSGRAGDLGRL
jgi:glycine betaine/proline transport system substrate-binding protein